MSLSTYKMIIAYDGTEYSGWQVQINGTSIQTILQNALSTILREKTDVTGSGRTDAGVHALGQVAHFHSEATLDLYRLLLSINSLLPHDIRVKSIEKVENSFHSRYDATSKIYHYHLHLDRVMDPFKRRYCMHVLEKIDLSILEKGTKMLLGTHDFTSFANEAHRGTAARNGIRTLERFDILPESGGIRLELQADGFLYKMVRNIVGTLIDVASGRIPIEQIPQIISEKDRKKAGFAAPPQGLFLVQVIYGGKSAISKNDEYLGTLGISSS